MPTPAPSARRPWRSRRLAARAALAVPSLTLLAAATALLAGASPRAVDAVRVFGGPAEGPGPHALRVACVRHVLGVEEPLALDGVELEVEGLVARASCDAAGHADLTLPAGAPLPARPHLVARRGGGVLARGRVGAGARAWRDAFVPRPARVPVAAPPARPLELSLPGGALAVGQRARAWLRGPAPEAGPPRLLGLGAEVGAPALVGGGGAWTFDVRPTFVQATLGVGPGPRDDGAWQAEASLPVVAGAPVVEALADDAGTLRAVVRSPAGRAEAYVRLVDLDGRRFGAKVPLGRASADGWPEGDLAVPAPPPGAAGWLVVSASVEGGPAVTLPLPPDAEPRDGAWAPDALWADGLVEALDAERARRRRGRRAVTGLVASGALLEAWLLLALQRARRSVAAPPAALGAPDDRPLPLGPLGAGRLALALGVVWLGFVVLGVLLGAGLDP
jgi:hypothetical protein